MKNIIKISKLSKSYPSPDENEAVDVFSEVNLDVEEGSSIAIVGPSGSGKSTLLNMIGLLDKPSDGSIEVNRIKLSSLSDRAIAEYRNQSVGFVFQSHHLLPSCTVLENVLVPALAGFGQLHGEDLHNRGLELLKEVGLAHRLSHLPSQISGGEKQRVAVARALINTPSVLLADEPTGALDQKNSNLLFDLLSKLNVQKKVTLLMVTHSVESANKMQHIYHLQDGDLRQQK